MTCMSFAGCSVNRASPHFVRAKVIFRRHGTQKYDLCLIPSQMWCLCMWDLLGRCFLLSRRRFVLPCRSIQIPECLLFGREQVSRSSPTNIGQASERGRRRKVQHTRMKRDHLAILCLSKVVTSFLIHSQVKGTLLLVCLKPLMSFSLVAPLRQACTLLSSHFMDRFSTSQKFLK